MQLFPLQRTNAGCETGGVIIAISWLSDSSHNGVSAIRTFQHTQVNPQFNTACVHGVYGGRQPFWLAKSSLL